jgi:hypothetical protein
MISLNSESIDGREAAKAGGTARPSAYDAETNCPLRYSAVMGCTTSSGQKQLRVLV